jgi:SAM-dependent methyltransferase
MRPNWLDWVALLRGAEPPHDTRCVLELGCGQGFGLCVLAAANPEHRFVGLDFNPEHIAHARGLVRRTGLTNIEFHEGDFLALAQAPELPWPMRLSHRPRHPQLDQRLDPPGPVPNRRPQPRPRRTSLLQLQVGWVE